MSQRRHSPGKVLVLDADGQAALSVIRSLGRRGVPVTAGSTATPSIGALSKYSAGAVWYPPPESDPGAFRESLLDTLADASYEALVPVGDAASAVVARYKDDFTATGATVGVEDWPRFERAYDKARTFDMAETLPVPTPTTRAPSSLDEVADIAEDLPYPVVVKPRSKHVWEGEAELVRHRVGDSNYATSPASLRRTFADLFESRPAFREHPPIVQEYVDGETTTTVGVAEDGRFLAHFQERRLRTTPASGGNSTLIRGMRDERMREYAESVVAALGWTGPIQVEFMRTPAGEYYLIEVNGRYWGSTPLAVASGVDIPWLHYCQLVGQPFARPDRYRDDVVQQRLFYGDLKWLGERLSDGHPESLVGFCDALLDAQQVFFSIDDPLPTVGTLGKALRMGASGLAHRIRSDTDDR